MNRTTGIPRTAVPATRSWKTSQAIVGALALLCTAPAFAAPITFESIVPIGYAAGDTTTENGFNILMLDAPFAA